jgi:hypothetical protein
MTDSSAAQLLAEFDQKRKKVRLAPIVGVIGAIGIIVAFGSGGPLYLPAAALVAVVALVWLAKTRDELAKTVVLFYELEDDAARRYKQLHEGFDSLGTCGGKWRIEAQGATRDQKHHAGATSLISRKSILLTKGQPPFVKTNIEVPTIPLGRRTLWFFPDRILVFEATGVGAVRYEDAHIARTSSRYIEDAAVPADAKVVGHTWKYVNKGGGPDKRFKDNRQLPIAQYEQVHLTSANGLNELLQVSRVDGGLQLEEAIKGMANNHALKAGSTAV